jgi:hypothetical protein
VPVTGEAAAQQDALDLSWVTPAEALSPSVASEMGGGHDKLVRLALSHAGI